MDDSRDTEELVRPESEERANLAEVMDSRLASVKEMGILSPEKLKAYSRFIDKKK